MIRAAALLGALVLAGCAGEAAGPALAVGAEHACAIRGGRARCWGSDRMGQRGADGAEARAIFAGGETTCWIDPAARLWCAGHNHHGQLGDGTLASRSTPGRVLDDVATASVGFAHACAVDDAGQGWCWGWNALGQVRPGLESDVPSPVRVREEATLRRVAAGFDTSCAIDDRDALTCWGAIEVPPLEGVVDVAVGADHVCAATEEALECFGRAPGGDGPPLDPPLRLPLPGARVAAAFDHVCALSEGAVRCFGKNAEGQLGTGDQVARARPDEAAELPAPITALGVGDRHSCALAADAVFCWGWNDRGQLGDDASPPSLVPVETSLGGSFE